MKDVPYIIVEAMTVRFERIIKYLITALVIVVILLFASNAIWIYEWTQYDYSGTQSIDLNADTGNANYIGNDGDISNGKN